MEAIRTVIEQFLKITIKEFHKLLLILWFIQIIRVRYFQYTTTHRIRLKNTNDFHKIEQLNIFQFVVSQLRH